LSRREQRLQCSEIFSNACRISCRDLRAHATIRCRNSLHDSWQIRGAIHACRGWTCGSRCSSSTTSTATTSTAASALTTARCSSWCLSCDGRDHYGENNTNRNK
jgi:hypothetical protein